MKPMKQLPAGSPVAGGCTCERTIVKHSRHQLPALVLRVHKRRAVNVENQQRLNTLVHVLMTLTGGM